MNSLGNGHLVLSSAYVSKSSRGSGKFEAVLVKSVKTLFSNSSRSEALKKTKVVFMLWIACTYSTLPFFQLENNTLKTHKNRDGFANLTFSKNPEVS